MESIDYWKLCDEFSVIQAALLLVGEDPSTEQHYVEGHPPEKRPVGYEAAKSALQKAILSGKLDAQKNYDAKNGRGYMSETGWVQDVSAEDGEEQFDVGQRVFIYKREPNWDKTTISRDGIADWLKKRGITDSFFCNEKESNEPNYLDSKNPSYSPKLAAALNAWLAITSDKSLVKGKSVKKALLVWLRANAGKFGLIKEDGNPNESGIEEIAKVANWEIKGGAPKTPEGD